MTLGQWGRLIGRSIRRPYALAIPMPRAGLWSALRHGGSCWVDDEEATVSKFGPGTRDHGRALDLFGGESETAVGIRLRSRFADADSGDGGFVSGGGVVVRGATLARRPAWGSGLNVRGRAIEVGSRILKKAGGCPHDNRRVSATPRICEADKSNASFTIP